jgi:D-arabinose 1-dehydrogenase-like Zn-dependent alcohol dehydrogenase
MQTMQAIQVSRAGGNFEVVERPLPEPGPTEVRFKVEACGICHSDQLVKDGLWPGIPYPRVPGHEVMGRIDKVGSGITAWKAGQRVGVGGLGHLGIQFASKMGFKTIAISTGKDKEKLAPKLGASHYIDAAVADPAQQLQKLGGAYPILATAPSGKAIAPLVSGLTVRGKLLIVAAAPDPIEIAPISLLSGRAIAGCPSGAARDSHDTLEFSALSGVRPAIEVFPMLRVPEDHERMITGKVRFRAVLKMSS